MERKATVDSIAKKLSSSRAATKALSKALTEAEIYRKRAVEVRGLCIELGALASIMKSSIRHNRLTSIFL